MSQANSLSFNRSNLIAIRDAFARRFFLERRRAIDQVRPRPRKGARQSPVVIDHLGFWLRNVERTAGDLALEEAARVARDVLRTSDVDFLAKAIELAGIHVSNGLATLGGQDQEEVEPTQH